MNKDYLKEGIYSGLIAGLVFLMLEMIMVPLFLNGSPWGPPRMIAAMVLGQDVLQPATFDLGVIMMAMMIHFALSAIYGLILASMVRNVTKGTAILIGGAFGLALYILNFYLIANLLFPWFQNATNWVSLVTHVIFGASTGYAIKAFQGKYEPNCVTC